MFKSQIYLFRNDPQKRKYLCIIFPYLMNDPVLGCRMSPIIWRQVVQGVQNGTSQLLCRRRWVCLGLLWGSSITSVILDYHNSGQYPTISSLFPEPDRRDCFRPKQNNQIFVKRLVMVEEEVNMGWRVWEHGSDFTDQLIGKCPFHHWNHLYSRHWLF